MNRWQMEESFTKKNRKTPLYYREKAHKERQFLEVF